MRKLLVLSLLMGGASVQLNAGAFSQVFNGLEVAQKASAGRFQPSEKLLELGLAKKNLKFQILKSQISSLSAVLGKHNKAQAPLKILDGYFDEKLEITQKWYAHILPKIQDGSLNNLLEYQEYKRSNKPSSLFAFELKVYEKLSSAITHGENQGTLKASLSDAGIQDAYKSVVAKQMDLMKAFLSSEVEEMLKKARHNLRYHLVSWHNPKVTEQDWEEYQAAKKQQLDYLDSSNKKREGNLSFVVKLNCPKGRAMGKHEKVAEEAWKEFNTASRKMDEAVLLTTPTPEGVEEIFKATVPNLTNTLQHLTVMSPAAPEAAKVDVFANALLMRHKKVQLEIYGGKDSKSASSKTKLTKKAKAKARHQFLLQRENNKDK